MEKTLTTREFVKKVCKEGSDESITSLIQEWKTERFPSFVESSTETWFDVTEKYFKKYLKMFGRTNISL
jgi:hypothetical protein